MLGGGEVRRADVVPGTRGRSTADGRIIDLIDSHFREAAISIRLLWQDGYEMVGLVDRADRDRWGLRIVRGMPLEAASVFAAWACLRIARAALLGAFGLY